MADDGSATVLTGAIDVGQGSETVIAQIVAEELFLPIEDVKIVSSDTDTTPQDIGAWISGMTYVTGNAARQAAGNARDKMLQLAAQRFNCGVDDLYVADKVVYNRLDPAQSMSYRDIIALSIATRRGDTVIGEGFWRTMRDVPTHPSLATTKGRWSENYAFSCQTAEVEVDTETGEARVLKALTVHDCGFPVNPALVKNQVDGQVSMALGHAFLEEIMMKDGYTLNPTWLDYRMPTIHEMAESDDADVITEEYVVGKPYRTKEVGEVWCRACWPPSPTPSTTPPACACTRRRSRPRRSSKGCASWSGNAVSGRRETPKYSRAVMAGPDPAIHARQTGRGYPGQARA